MMDMINKENMSLWIKAYRESEIGDFRVYQLLDVVVSELEENKSALDDLSKRFTALIQQNSALAADNERLTEELKKQKEMTIACADELIQAASELSGIKKQEHSAYVQSVDRSWDICINAVDDDLKKGDLLYKYPVHQHSFTLSGIGTFYADSELEITYLERLHGVGGKANLKALDEENF